MINQCAVKKGMQLADIIDTTALACESGEIDNPAELFREAAKTMRWYVGHCVACQKHETSSRCHPN
jgi:hypothetical protein